MIGRALWMAAVLLALAGPSFAQGDAMVASQESLASDVGAQVLGRGGNAVDAVIATAFALAVTHPTAGNIGGGGFMLIRLADGKATTIDFRECAPAAATAKMFLDPSGEYSERLHHDSHVSVGVPGTVAGLWLAHRRHGRLPWMDLVAPAVALARDGIKTTPALHQSMRREIEKLRRHEATRDALLGGSMDVPEVGSLWRQPDLARTLERILVSGAAGFYRGETASLITKEMRRGGGLITLEDLAAYRAIERTPVTGTYRGHEVISVPPPSSGGITLIAMLNMLECFPAERSPVVRIHLLAEIMRRGYAERARHLGDPEFADVPAMHRLMDKGHARELARTIDLGATSPSTIQGLAWRAPEGDETTHVSVIDADGNAVAMTYTLEERYGSGIVVPGAGFLLNNEMGDFNPREGMTTDRGHIGTLPNLVAPGKRMLSSMTPTIVVRRGEPVLVLGSPGGRTIINTVFQIISNVVDLRMSIEKAVALGRMHHQWFPDRILAEERLVDDEMRAELEKIGHRIRMVKSIGAAECIQSRTRRNRRRLAAGIDPRAPGGGAASPMSRKDRE